MPRFSPGSSLAHRLYLLLALFVVSITAIAGYNLYALRSGLVAQKETELRHLAEAALSIARDEQAAAARGDKSEEAARRAAAERIGRLRYGRTTISGSTTPRPDGDASDQSAAERPGSLGLRGSDRQAHLRRVCAPRPRWRRCPCLSVAEARRPDPTAQAVARHRLCPLGWVIGTASTSTIWKPPSGGRPHQHSRRSDHRRRRLPRLLAHGAGDLVVHHPHDRHDECRGRGGSDGRGSGPGPPRRDRRHGASRRGVQGQRRRARAAGGTDGPRRGGQARLCRQAERHAGCLQDVG